MLVLKRFLKVIDL